MLYECETVKGLESLTQSELRKWLGSQVQVRRASQDSALSFEYSSGLPDISKLKLPINIYSVMSFGGKRPSIILGDANWRKVIFEIVRLREKDQLASFRLSAAGKKSSLMHRIAQRVSDDTSLTNDEEQGELLIRIRPSAYVESGWDVLFRQSKLPLSTRAWRVANMPGALNASLACSMLTLARSKGSSRVLHLMSGSGTLPIEHALHYPYQSLVAVEISDAHLDLCRKNISAAGVGEKIDLLQADAQDLPFGDCSFQVATCNLPWGERVGDREENLSLYSHVVREVERVLTVGGRFVALTQQSKEFLKVLEESQLSLLEQLKVSQRGFHPTIFVVEKKGK